MKSLYGLKQAPKQWHEKFDNVMLSHGFKINECDKCVYVKDDEHGYVIVCLYVDDMLIVGSDGKMITSTKNMLNSRFDMKDMGLADVIFGIKIKRTLDGLVLCQSHCVNNILGKFDPQWKSSKQTVIARSTMEYEFIALDKCGEEAEWLRHFLEDIPRWPKPVPPICIHCDSQSAIGRAQNSMYNVSLDISVIDTIPLNNNSQLGLSL